MAASAIVLILIPGLPGGPVPVSARRQAPAATASTRITDRIRTLRREAEALMGEERSLLGDLRRLEVERDLRAEETRQLEGEIDAVTRQADAATSQITALEQAIRAARPSLDARLVDVYKLGQPGYARLLLGVSDMRDLGRTTRAVTALARIDERRVQAFASSVAQLSAARADFDHQAARLRALQDNARMAADLAQKAAAARVALVRQIDARRDLNARMVGELELAGKKLDRTMQGANAAPAPAGFAVRSIKPFRGALEWPVPGQVLARFGERRLPEAGPGIARNGLEIGAADGQPVRSVHEGRVVFADLFTALGQLVIVDHGGLAFSLYGYLGSTAVTRGALVTRGQIVGTAGRAPGGQPAVYFELRIDGQPVDPLQWLRAR